MMLMAIDHASAMVARTHFTEVWGLDFAGYPDLGWWFARFVSHQCAPGFFFLMGMSMVLFAYKRSTSEKEKWTTARIRQYFFKRGGLILLFMIFLEFPGWGLSGFFNASERIGTGPPLPGYFEGGFFFPTTVLYGLGICMIVGALLWRLAKVWLLAITIFSFAFSTIYVGQLAPDEALNPLAVLLFVPGITFGAMSIYPLIPWIGVTTFGMFWAKILRAYPKQVYNYALFNGLIFIVLFVLLRSMEWSNFQLNEYHDVISYFSLIKYPPSISFFLWTVGMNLILLFLFAQISGQKWLKPVRLYGQTAMFFYIVHLYLYALMGAAFPTGCSIYVMYMVWAMGLVILYFICARFLAFKKSTDPDSLWRMV